MMAVQAGRVAKTSREEAYKFSDMVLEASRRGNRNQFPWRWSID